MTRLLGIDLGTRRVGLAIAEAGDVRARPLTTVARRRTAAADAEALARIVAANRVDEVIVGLPYDMDGGEGAMALQARAWAAAIAEHLGLPVRLRDERLSSHVAESRVGATAGRGRAGGPPGPVRRAAHRARIDREAAAVILEDELAARLVGQPGEIVAMPAPVENANGERG